MIFHHCLTYPDGREFKGKIDHRREPAFFGLTQMAGLRVLDLASNDGFFAFWSEWSGAAAVDATDVEDYRSYDWGPPGPPASADSLPQPDKAEAFWFHHKNLNSKARRYAESVYELEPPPQYDFIWNYGLIYHLRHPLLALERCAAACKGMMALETLVNIVNPGLSYCVFHHEGLGTVPGDFTCATPACIASWLKSAGFKDIFIQREPFNDRWRFAATMTPEWKAHIEATGNFTYCDDEFWKLLKGRLGK